MKNTIATCFYILICVYSFSQPSTNKTYDFSKVDLQKISIGKIEDQQEKINDSLIKNILTDSLSRLLDLVHQKTKSYEGISVGVAFPSAQINKINNELSQNGFVPLSTHFTEINIGFFRKQKRWIHEVQYYFSLNNKSQMDNTSVKLLEGSAGYTVGYDLLDIPWLTVYPYAGPSYQFAQLIIEKQQHSASEATLFGTSADYEKTTITKGQLNGTIGGEADFYIIHPKNNNNFFLTISARYGASLMLIDGRYKANGHHIQYYPDWDFRNSFGALSIKIGGY
jgi:hypothetical protein